MFFSRLLLISLFLGACGTDQNINFRTESRMTAKERDFRSLDSGYTQPPQNTKGSAESSPAGSRTDVLYYKGEVIACVEVLDGSYVSYPEAINVEEEAGLQCGRFEDETIQVCESGAQTSYILDPILYCN